MKYLSYYSIINMSNDPQYLPVRKSSQICQISSNKRWNAPNQLTWHHLCFHLSNRLSILSGLHSEQFRSFRVSQSWLFTQMLNYMYPTACVAIKKRNIMCILGLNVDCVDRKFIPERAPCDEAYLGNFITYCIELITQGAPNGDSSCWV